MGLFGLFSSESTSSTKYDNTVNTTNLSDSYNTTYSTVNNSSDIGNVKVNEPSINNKSNWILPTVAIAAIIIFLLYLKK